MHVCICMFITCGSEPGEIKWQKLKLDLENKKKEHIFPEYSEVFVASNRNMYYSALASIDGYVPSFTLSQPLIIHLTFPTKLYFKRTPSKSITSSWKRGPGFKFLSTHYFPRLIIAETAIRTRRKMAKRHTLSSSLHLTTQFSNFLTIN